MKDIIRIGFLGASRLGKTTIIALIAARLAKIQLISLALGDSGRTKVTTEYLFRKDWYGDDDRSAEVTLIRIDRWAVVNFMRNYNAHKTIDEFNAADVKFIVNNLFRILDIADFQGDTDPADYIATRVASSYSEDLILTKEIELDDLRKILNYGKVDKFIKRIVISVPPAFELKADLLIRDTRGLLDFEIDDKGVINTDFSPRDVGMENLDAIVFVCSENYEAGAEKLYKKMLTDLMQSLPIFFIKNRYDNLFEYYEDNRAGGDIKTYIEDIQSGKISMFRRFDSKFKETYKFLENFGVTVQDDDKTWHLSDGYFEDENSIKFAIPTCESLLELSTDSAINKSDVNDIQKHVGDMIEEADMIFCSSMVINVFDIIINKLTVFFEHVQLLFKSNKAKKLIVDKLSSFEQIVDDNIDSYTANHGNAYVPRVAGWAPHKIVDTINDSTGYNILGPRYGITTRYDNRYEYGPTLALAVACKRCLYSVVNSINLTEHITDDAGNVILSDASVATENKIFRKGLMYVLYNRMMDIDATFSGELFINRFEIRDDIDAIKIKSDKFRDVMVKDMAAFISSNMDSLDGHAVMSDRK